MASHMHSPLSSVSSSGREGACLGCQIVNKYLWKVNTQNVAALGDVWISVCHSSVGHRRLLLPGKLTKAGLVLSRWSTPGGVTDH